MSSTASKKKFGFWKLLIWIFVILVALNIITDGEFSEGIEDFFDDAFDSQDYVPSTQPAYMGITIEEQEGILGAYISAVNPDSPAERAGLQTGDVIVTIGDVSVNSLDDAYSALDQYHAYDTTNITVLRNDKYLALSLTFGKRPSSATTAPTTVDTTLPGYTVPGSTVSPTIAPTVPPTVAPTVPSVDLLPSVPEELRGHVYLTSRGKGYCESLTGNVVATILFVSNPDAGWSDAEIENAKIQLQTVADRINADAATYGAQLNLTLQYKTAFTSVKIENGETADWMASALSAAGLPELRDTNPTLESSYGVTAAPVIFFANHGGRAFASSYRGSEYAILYQDTHAFYHELSHIFGAKDFYYPTDVKTISKTYLPDSIMVSSSSGVMDEFTAYLIGWTDTLSDNALSFLRETAYLTQEYLNEEHEKETYTGYVTDFTYGYGSYTGYLVCGVKHGQGKWIREDGTVWEGTFNNGSFTGKGNFIYANGDTYDGQWVDGRWHGTGTYRWVEGSSYTGAYVNGERTGKGTWTGNTGNTYIGDFVKGKFHGQGTFTWADGGSYTGGYDNGLRSGYGTMVYSNGAVYEGNWLGGKRHGKGTYTNANGDTYAGDWSEDQRNGQGTYTWADGSKYAGNFVDGLRHGYGIYYYSNGNRYEGNWENGKRSGQGTFTYVNGNVYTGNWVNDAWNGQGTFTWSNGDKYTGAFVDGKRHGYGIYYFPSGNRYEGNWKNGERHGQGTMYYANGTVQSGTWENGKFKG